jgi:hypothetical protein
MAKAFGKLDLASTFDAALQDVADLRAIERTDFLAYGRVADRCVGSIWHLTDWLFREAVTRGVPIAGVSYADTRAELIRFQDWVRAQSDEMATCYQFATFGKHAEVGKDDPAFHATASAVYVMSTPKSIHVQGVLDDGPASVTLELPPPSYVHKVSVRGLNRIPLEVFEAAVTYMRNLVIASGLN